MLKKGLLKRAVEAVLYQCCTLPLPGFGRSIKRLNIGKLKTQVLSFHPTDEGALVNYAVLLTNWRGDYATAESLYR